jgi:ADP-ribose pyrophosphatase YjhB (NUDIX family)
MAPVDRIRNIAVGLVVRDGHALVEIYPANDRHDVFARVLGGGIEFCERAADAVRREFAEELGFTRVDAELLTVTENIFDAGRATGHEIVHVYAMAGAELDALDLSDVLPVQDSDTSARWVALSALRALDPPLSPAGIIEIAESLDRTAR